MTNNRAFFILPVVFLLTACSGGAGPSGGSRGPNPPGSASATGSAGPVLEGCLYVEARAFAGKYCSDCHSSRGSNDLRGRASRILSVDSYGEWIGSAGAIPGRLDLDSLELGPMPPPEYPVQPTQAERRMIVDWVKRGSPNTPDGR